jgi:D-glycero-alpha-D-manno-heptose-7-phosphate kinase
MTVSIKKLLESGSVEASAPCRIDLGGTLDIKTFYYQLHHLSPCTFNIAIRLRTSVRLYPYKNDMIKISSTGFADTEYPADRVPFDHSLGLMFSIASYFRASGVHIVIDSVSPPRSALGGSSAAAVALIGAFSKLFESAGQPSFSLEKTAMLAHTIEESVAGVPCGMQDQLAAAYGGVNAWYWNGDAAGPAYEQKVLAEKKQYQKLEKQILLAYCGMPHESKNINGKWVRQFLSGRYRKLWAEIAGFAHSFVEAFAGSDIKKALKAMNNEMEIRRKMTPEVLDAMGDKLVKSVVENGCGARFTGAGGGGCIWALGEEEDVLRLKGLWEGLLADQEEARLLPVEIDPDGLKTRDI